MTILSCKESVEVNIKSEKTNTKIESKFLNLDSIQDRNNKNIEIAGNHVNKLIISRKDSLIWITSSKYLDHRIFGYEKPNLNSKKMILSVKKKKIYHFFATSQHKKNSDLSKLNTKSNFGKSQNKKKGSDFVYSCGCRLLF